MSHHLARQDEPSVTTDFLLDFGDERFERGISRLPGAAHDIGQGRRRRQVLGDDLHLGAQVAAAQKRYAHGRIYRGHDAGRACTFEHGFKNHPSILSDIERPSSVEAFVIEGQEGYRALLRQRQFRMLDPVKLLAEQDDVGRSDLMSEDLQDRSLQFAPIQHCPQDQTHADLGADGDVRMQAAKSR